MGSLEPFHINLKGLKNGESMLTFELHDDYFEAIEAPEISRGDLCVELSVRRTDSLFELNFHTKGVVQISCDLCLDNMEQPIDTNGKLLVKFGEEYSEDDELITVPENEGILDVSWFVYEFIELEIPIRHVHAPGNCNPAMMKVLQEHSATRSDAGNTETAVDSRWAGLEKLRTTIKD